MLICSTSKGSWRAETKVSTDYWGYVSFGDSKIWRSLTGSDGKLYVSAWTVAMLITGGYVSWIVDENKSVTKSKQTRVSLYKVKSSV